MVVPASIPEVPRLGWARAQTKRGRLSGAVPAEMAVPAEIAVAVFGTHATLSLEPVDMLGRAQRTPGPVVLEASARGRRGGEGRVCESVSSLSLHASRVSYHITNSCQ